MYPAAHSQLRASSAPALRCLLVSGLAALALACVQSLPLELAKGGTTTDSLRQALLGPVPSSVLSAAEAEHARLLGEGLFYPDRHPDVSRVQRMLDRLVRFSFKPDFELVAHVIQDPNVNAFVTGGRHVYVFAGLLQSVASEDELAGVLAHEISHIDAGHRSRRSRSDVAQQLGLFLVELLTARTDDPELASALKVGVLLVGASYSRALEEEADVLGVRLASLAGYDASRVEDFHRRSQAEFATRQRDYERRRRQLDQRKAQVCPSLTGMVLDSLSGRLLGEQQTPAQKARCQRVKQAVEKEKLQLRIEQMLEGRLRSHPSPQNRLALVDAADRYYGPPFKLDPGSILMDTNYKVAQVVDKICLDAKLNLLDAHCPPHAALSGSGRPDAGGAARQVGAIPARDAQLLQAQIQLDRLDYDCGSPDGRMGPRTSACIRKFQRDLGLPESGELDPDVQRKLGMSTRR